MEIGLAEGTFYKGMLFSLGCGVGSQNKQPEEERENHVNRSFV